MSRNSFLDTPEDVQWLKDTHLNGVPLGKYAGFKCAVLQGHEDSPYAVNLYMAQNPHYMDPFFRVRFVNNGVIYCEMDETDRSDAKLREQL